MPWRCSHCRTVHRHNPGKCRNCDRTVFDTVSFEQLANQADEFESAKPMEIGNKNRLGTAPEPSEIGVKGPDVNLDGSVSKPATDEESADRNGERDGIVSRVRGFLSF